MTRLSEGRLSFDSSAALQAERFDERGRRIPVGMSLVDFVVELHGRLLLVEIKDPQGAAARHRKKAIEHFMTALRTDRLISETLVPKARDSYTYLHLMARDGKHITFVVLLGIAADAAFLQDVKNRLLSRIRQETDKPWARRYVADCVVLTLENWPVVFPDFPLSVAQGA